jgi:hypothetical protein
MQLRCAASSSMVYTAADCARWTRPPSSAWEEGLFPTVAYVLTPVRIAVLSVDRTWLCGTR